MQIEVEIAPGELFDKLTILEIKLKHITNKDKLVHIEKEWMMLRKWTNKCYAAVKKQHYDNLESLTKQLKNINQQIWDIEDDIRECERQQDFSDRFVQLARSVYITNDKRAAVKKEISTLFNSDIMEEKSYTNYQN